MPNNIVAAAADGDLLSLLICTILFGLALTSLPASQRDPVVRGIRGLAQALLVLVHWVLAVTPLGVFTFTLALALETGSAAVGMLGVFVALQCGLMLVATALFYPVTAIVGRVSLGAFARAVAPAQVVAVSTRSSIASLPAMVEGGRARLGLPESATGFILPFSNAIFKPNRAVTSTVKVLFLAHLYGISLTPVDIITFNAAVILLSFTAVGIPGGGAAFRNLPAYVALGIPVEGLVILEAADTIPDIFKTLMNVTGQMSAATMLAPGHRVPTA